MSTAERLLAEQAVETGLACPGCGAASLSAAFYEQAAIPIHSCRLVRTRTEALKFPRGDLRLAFCHGCGLIVNTAYDGGVQDYGIAYEETQGFSPRFRDFARELAQRWIDRYDVRGQQIVEIGCGKGEFLAMMCELGGNSGLGIDPAFVEERLTTPASSRLSFVNALYDGNWGPLDADAVVCRHTIEHIAPVGDFMASIRAGIGERDGTIVLFDLPDVVRVLREAAFWDIYYEHCTYLSPGSLARLFRRSGFDVLALELDYDDQYIVLEARPATGGPPEIHPLEESVESLHALVTDFADTLARTRARWESELAATRADGGSAVIWGAGSKGVAFLSTLGAGADVAAAVDINPHKQGMFIAGTGHEVLAPESLRDLRPELVIAMNSIYVDEIRGQLQPLGLSPRVVGV